MVNPNCLGAVMLSHIKKSCGYADISENIDLASETGEVVDLVSRPREYARKFLEPRGSYILVKVIGDEMEDSSPTYISLLDQAGEKIKFSVFLIFFICNAAIIHPFSGNDSISYKPNIQNADQRQDRNQRRSAKIR
ncbi:hypothetical protein BDEG_21200 [Batrachochytrium dendrobatidis JEL423]|uniref:Uncharacterized protein n=1 Tax=Batrachochytrium dendrobatidis (strain JEL423) TaxID=403673 RepID=A0A177WAK2_BATDL|nr:hypothetical protein BDEG_21200 [Batrachochytrium dendrobatidis JEL423]